MGEDTSKGLHLMLKKNIDDENPIKIPHDGELIFTAKTGYSFFVYVKEHQKELDLLNKEIEKVKERYQELHKQYLEGKKTKTTDDANKVVRDKNITEKKTSSKNQ